MMLIRDKVEHAVRLQAYGYELLKWLERAFTDGFITPEAAGAYATSEDAAYAWLDKHYLNLPVQARPERAELRALGNLFSTYLESTFDLDVRPREGLHSSSPHCPCPFCRWMARGRHMTPKRVESRDKRAAERMKRNFLLGLAASHGTFAVSDETLDHVLQATEFREPVGLCAYAADLLHRLDGRSAGAATLVLWRTFAWTIEGSPKRRFVLTADAIMSAQDVLTDRLQLRAG